ncbi:MAG: Galactokinase [Sporanaerobacter sp.]|jgi:galactokinase|uniref:galactokinase n=1 Tax=Sporanaerobacter sp. TaxID=2010183 RepID=UPI003A100993
MDLCSLIDRFHEIYGFGEIRKFFSPSRVNLIGEHIDYNGGHVLPCALEIGTYGLVRKRDDNNIRLASENFELKVEVNIEDLKYKSQDGWGNYPKGVIYFMKQKGYRISGMDILVWGNIPNGAGLSSSASLELLIAEIINSLFNDGRIPKIDLIKLCQEAENEFIGVRCGIMDQFAISMGKKDKVILLDCSSLQFEYIDININMNDCILVIMNTNKRRKLNESRYNERRDECKKALNIIKNYKDIDNLCQISIEEYEEVEKHIFEDCIKKRVRHVVYENQRVLNAAEALKNGDINRVGKLLVESHNSLKDLYEVTGNELDTIVEVSLEQSGCIGARMTGGGFGGCAIAIVKNDSVDNFINKVGTLYKRKIGYSPEFYITGIGHGTRELF